MRATFLNKTNAHEWLDAAVLVAGSEVKSNSAVAQVGITSACGHRVRIDIQHSAGHSCFHDAQCVENIAYIGYGQYIFVAHPLRMSIISHTLDGYFGHLYSAKKFNILPTQFAMLVASASELLCFSKDGRLRWQVRRLGVDGVIVDSIQNNLVNGSGECDPPDGWQEFNICIHTGAKCRHIEHKHLNNRRPQ
jgi:hypothetical protein